MVLVGMMGAGKSTVGRALADRLGWAFLDTDEVIERTVGRTVAEVFAADGEAAFRAEERRALAGALPATPAATPAGKSTDGPVVLSVGGGAVLDPENRRQLREADLVVWLRAEVPTLAARVGAGAGDERPLLGDDPVAALARLLRERRALYEELADLVVDVDDLTPADAVERIVVALG